MLGIGSKDKSSFLTGGDARQVHEPGYPVLRAPLPLRSLLGRFLQA
jgi:hypothetical protein